MMSISLWQCLLYSIAELVIETVELIIYIPGDVEMRPDTWFGSKNYYICGNKRTGNDESEVRQN